MNHENLDDPTANSTISKVVKTFQMSLSQPRESTQGSNSATNIDTYMVKVIELLPQVHMWPSSVLLSAYLLAHPSKFQDKVVFDLGAGCGLTSIAASLTECKHVICSERNDEEALIKNLQSVIALNKQELLISPDASIEVIPFSWGDHEDSNHPIFQQQQKDHDYNSQTIDIILGSDVFYSSEDIDPILSVVYTLMRLNPELIFYAAYQQRSISRSMAPHLSKFGMKAEVVDSAEFLHPYHLQAMREEDVCSDHEDQFTEKFSSSYSFENLESITLIKVSNL